MKICYTEQVETGHIDEVGGTLEISITVDKENWNDKIEEIIDYLDHTTIIPSGKSHLKNLTRRYFIVNEFQRNNNFVVSVFNILSYFLKELNIDKFSIDIKYGKFTYKFNEKDISKNYHIKETIVEYSDEIFRS